MLNLLGLFIQFSFFFFYRKYNKILLPVFVIMSIALVSVSLIHYTELMVLGQNTYGSDAEFYWRNAISGNDISALPASGYIYLERLITGASTNHFIWVILFNVQLYVFICCQLLIICLDATCENLNQANLFNQLLFLFLVLNGILLWTVVKGVKETFFLFLTVQPIFFTRQLVKKRTIRVISILIVILCLLNVNSIKMGYVYIAIIGIFLSFRIEKIINKGERLSLKTLFYLDKQRKMWPTIFLITCIILIFWSQIFYAFKYFLIYKDFVQETGITSGFSNPILDFFRFFLGPGPIRSFKQIIFGNIFIASSKVGDILIFFGSLQWWLSIFIVLYVIILKKVRFWSICLIFFDFFFLTLTHIVTYVIVYGGTGDTRHRAVMYFLLIPLIYYAVGTNRKLRQPESNYS